MSYLDILRRLEQDKGVRQGLVRIDAEETFSPLPVPRSLTEKEKSPHGAEPSQHTLRPNSLIWWRSMDGETRGPAVLLGTFGDKGQIWAWFTLGGIEYLIRTDLIVKVQRPEDE